MNIPKKSIFDEVVAIKREQVNYKKDFSNSFLNKLEEWFDRCYLNDKDKKEFFVTKEKLTLELLKLLQTQKKFKDSELIQNQICSVAVFDRESNLIGKVISINLIDNTVNFITMASLNSKEEVVVKKLSEVDMFDPYSIKMETYYKVQKTYYDAFNYKDTFTLLTGKEKKNENKSNDFNYFSLGRGIELDKKIKAKLDNIDLKD